jgi:cation diffusion facilitator family transporter
MQKGGDKDAIGPTRAGARKVVLAALAGNLAIAVTKFIAFAFSGSTAMLTEAIHSLVDTGDQLLLLVGQHRAAQPANASHPFGYGMETYFWSFIVALMIFLAGGAAAIWQGVERIRDPLPVNHPLISICVLAASALFEGLSFRTAYREYRRAVHCRNIRLLSFLRLSKDPNVFATILEDGAALTGLALAAAGVAGSAILGWHWADGLASVLIGVLLISVAAFMANETRSLIAGEAAADFIEENVRGALDQCAYLGQLVRMRTLHLGPQNILVAVCWRFDRSLSYAAALAGILKIQADIRTAEPRVADVLFEFVDQPAPPEAVSSAARDSLADDIAPPDPHALLREPRA